MGIPAVLSSRKLTVNDTQKLLDQINANDWVAFNRGGVTYVEMKMGQPVGEYARILKAMGRAEFELCKDPRLLDQETN